METLVDRLRQDNYKFGHHESVCVYLSSTHHRVCQPISSTSPLRRRELQSRHVVRSAALRFWRNFAQSEEEACVEALQFLTELSGGDDSFPVVLSESPDSSGKFVKVELPSTSPRNVQDVWASDKKTRLVRVDPLTHCLAYDGDISKYQGGDYFVACASMGSSTWDAAACTVGTHSQADRMRVAIDEPAFLIKVKPSSAATKPKILAGAKLYERDLPPMLRSEVFEELLQGFEAPPSSVESHS